MNGPYSDRTVLGETERGVYERDYYSVKRKAIEGCLNLASVAELKLNCLPRIGLESQRMS